jgi:hypothetical protein
MRTLIVLLLMLAAPAHAQVYRWIDARGTVHYSNTAPPKDAKADTLDLDLHPGNVAQSLPARPAAPEVQLADGRAAAGPPEPRGIEFRRLVTLRRGMSEGEVLAIAGAPDAHSRTKSVDRLTYLPTRADPFVTTITLHHGRIVDIEQARQF